MLCLLVGIMLHNMHTAMSNAMPNELPYHIPHYIHYNMSYMIYLDSPYNNLHRISCDVFTCYDY